MKKRHSAEQIVVMLRKADVDLGKGLKVPEACKQLGISEQTYCRWQSSKRRWIDIGLVTGESFCFHRKPTYGAEDTCRQRKNES
jgi:hypothetical protein